jgi:hypothetical protein
MQINNLSDRERLIADLMWSREGSEEIRELLTSLPEEDYQRARAISTLMVAGGDEVPFISVYVKDLLDSIAKR